MKNKFSYLAIIATAAVLAMAGCQGGNNDSLLAHKLVATGNEHSCSAVCLARPF